MAQQFGQFNPFFPYATGMTPKMQKTEILVFKGMDGAQAYNMPPDSSVLALDEADPIVYAVKTDSSGVKTIYRYSITPIPEVKEPTLSEIMDKMNKLEAMYYESNFRTNAVVEPTPIAEQPTTEPRPRNSKSYGSQRKPNDGGQNV